MEKKQRIAYYDVMKGVLICLVMFSHINYETLNVSHIENPTFRFLSNNQWVFTCFFMPAFFLVTGICSNFNKPFKPFLINNAKALLVPGIAFDLLLYTLPRICTDFGVVDELASFTRRVFWMGGIHWFLPSLFASKMIYWVLNKYLRNQFLIWVMLFVLFGYGYMANNYGLFPRKWWNTPQVCDLTIFLAIGQYYKNTTINKVKILRYSTFIFVGVLICFFLAHLKMPYIAAGYQIKELWQLPAHLLVATVGSFFLLLICKAIDHNALLEYFGKGSLVIYLVHSYVIKFLLIHWGDAQLAEISILSSACLFVVIFVLIAAVSCGVVWLCEKSFFRWLVGKW